MDPRNFLDEPSITPPLGVSRDFVNTTNMPIKYIFIYGLCVTVSMLATCMRIWTKKFLVRKMVLEDCKPLHASLL